MPTASQELPGSPRSTCAPLSPSGSLWPALASVELDADPLEPEVPADDVGGSVSRLSATSFGLGITDRYSWPGFPSRPSSKGRIDSALLALPALLPPPLLPPLPRLSALASSSELR